MASRLYSYRTQVSQFLRVLTYAMLIPTILGVGAAEWAGWRTGATMTPIAIARAQHADPTLIYAGDVSYYAALRLARIAIEQPDIIFVGTSRCTETRSRMLRPYKFYNMCATAGSIDQTSDMIERIMTVAHPKLIVFMLDYFMFSDRWDESVTEHMEMKQAYDFRWNFDGLIRLAAAVRSYPLRFTSALFRRRREPIDGDKLLGIDAIRDGAGFRFDGSILYPLFYQGEAPAHNASRTFGILQNAPAGPIMESNQIEELRRLVATAKRLNVHVVGMAMPLLGSTVDYLDNEPSYHHYSGMWREFQSAKTQRLFEDMGLHVIDLTRDPVKDDPRNFVDSGHPAESAILGAFVHHLDDPVFQATFPELDAAGLRDDYAKAQRDGSFFNIYHNRS